MILTLITVCYNSAGTIRTALDSVLAQRLAEGDALEYLVMDGGSSDGTIEILREYEPKFAGRMRFVSERDEGMYDAINKGIRRSTGDVIGILNADDYLDGDDVLLTVLSAFSREPSVFAAGAATPDRPTTSHEPPSLVYADVRFVRGESSETTRYYSSRPWKPWMHNWGYMPAHPTVYARREVFECYGLYKLGYDISADFEWMVRVLCRNRVSAQYIPRSLVVMRLGGKSTAGLRAMWRLNSENVRANRENGYFCCMLMMLPKYFFKIWGYVFRRRNGG